MLNKALLALLVVALVTLACGITVDLPFTQEKIGPTQIEDIHVPLLEPGSGTAEVTINFGAGLLNIDSGADDALVSGTATFNVADIGPEVTIAGEEVRLEQGNLDLTSIPTFSDGMVNTWDLEFADVPMELLINAGAYSGRLELGGLSLERLEINDGASDVRVEFSQANHTEMSLFRYTTGAEPARLWYAATHIQVTVNRRNQPGIGASPDLTPIGRTMVAAEVADEAAWIFTDFKIDNGFSRFLILNESMTQRQSRRTVRRLAEIETTASWRCSACRSPRRSAAGSTPVKSNSLN